jgi:A/G-specific adenine glycosylase
MPSAETLADFSEAVLTFYEREGRSFPWRYEADPWRVFVSEAMLQQTQTHRVLPKYLSWFERFAGPRELAEAPLQAVYEAWSGLGYNNRALRLREAARLVVERYGGALPRSEAELRALPGVGAYTARAVRAFAFGEPGAVLETNIRAALIFHFFPDRDRVGDRELEPLALALVEGRDPRRWYYALMDYGAWLKKREANPSRRSAAYARQSAFEGSARQARGAVLRALSAAGGYLPLDGLAAAAGLEPGRVEAAAASLAAEGLARYEAGGLRFAD